MGEAGLLAYCIRRAGEPPPPPGLTGIEGAPVRVLEAGELGIWVSPAPAEGAPTLERIRAHDAVVREALRSATPLPVRFGTRFAAEAEALASLRERRDALSASLERVAGRVEMGLRILWVPPEAEEEGAPERVAARSGREYLELRRREVERGDALRRRAEAVVDAVLAPLAPLALPTRRQLLPEREVAGIVAHLVHRTQLSHYRSRVEQASTGLRQVEVLRSGPWAPYSFV